jgi:hypothetical protein
MDQGVSYGQRSTLGASDMDLHIGIEDQVTKFPKYRRELINRWNSKNFKKSVDSHKYEWSTRSNRKLESTIVNGTSASGTQITVADAGVFNVDDVFQMKNGSQFYVTQVNGGFEVEFRKIPGGASQAICAGGETVTIVGMATPQGKDADTMVVKGFEDLYNYVSNFEDVVWLSDMENAAMIRGEEDSGQLIARKQMELTEKLQRALIAGIRFTDPTYKQTGMGGLKYLIDTYGNSDGKNVVDFGGAGTWSSDTLVETKIDSCLDVIAEKAFEKPVMYVTPNFMKKFKHIQESDIRFDLKEGSRGIGVVKTYNSHTFGPIDVVQLQGMNNVMSDNVFFLDESMVGYKAFKGLDWHTFPLARTGQSYKWQVAGVFTEKLDVPEAAVYCYNLGLS